MKAFIALLLSASLVSAFDALPISTYSYRGKTLTQASTVGAADDAVPTKKAFLVKSVFPFGLQCDVRVEVAGKKYPNGRMGPSSVKTIESDVLVVGYPKQDNVATGESFWATVEKGGVKNLGPEYGNLTLRVYKVTK